MYLVQFFIKKEHCNSVQYRYTVYVKKYAQSVCFVGFYCGLVTAKFTQVLHVFAGANTSAATLKDVGKYMMRIDYKEILSSQQNQT